MSDNNYPNNINDIQELVNEVDRLRTENYVLRQNIIYYHNFVKEHVNLKELYEKEGLLLNDLTTDYLYSPSGYSCKN